MSTDTAATLAARARELGDMLVRQYGFAPDGAVVTLTSDLADALDAALADAASLREERDALRDAINKHKREYEQAWRHNAGKRDANEALWAALSRVPAATPEGDDKGGDRG